MRAQSFMSRPRLCKVQRTQQRAPLLRRCQPESQQEAQPAQAEQQSQKCAHCGVGLSDVPFACDQQGHVAKGAGALFEWWPIKVWGPCSKAEAAGLKYTRKGQNLEQTLFGGAPPPKK